MKRPGLTVSARTSFCACLPLISHISTHPGTWSVDQNEALQLYRISSFAAIDGRAPTVHLYHEHCSINDKTHLGFTFVFSCIVKFHRRLFAEPTLLGTYDWTFRRRPHQLLLQCPEAHGNGTEVRGRRHDRFKRSYCFDCSCVLSLNSAFFCSVLEGRREDNVSNIWE